MRLAFLLLLFANLGFFAWARFLTPPDPAVDRRPLGRQIEPQRLRIVSERERAAAKPAPAKPAPKPDARPEATTAPPPAPVPIACLEWGSLSLPEASRAEQRLAPLALGARLAQHRGEESASWWVHMPPQGNRAGALRKAAELRKLGIGDYFVVQDSGPFQWSISLGVFSTGDAAEAHLKALQARGVRTAIISQRETRVPKVSFQIRDVDAPLEARLRDIAKEFEGATLHECAPRS